MDERYTWGRYVLDAACLGVPIITTRSTGHGDVLFPDVTVENAFEIGQAVRCARSVLDDDDRYNAVAAYAQEHIWQYNAPQVVSSLLRQLNPNLPPTSP